MRGGRLGIAGRGPATQRGFSLIAAVFLIVVLAALGTFAARMAVTQQQTVNLALLEAQAQAAAHSGIEYGANQALRWSQCPLSKALNLTATGMSGFSVVVQCKRTVHVPSGKTSYALISTATLGRYGRADFVSRQASRTVTTP